MTFLQRSVSNIGSESLYKMHRIDASYKASKLMLDWIPNLFTPGPAELGM